MILEQALFGEVKGGHGLRAASGDRGLATELVSRLDLPDNAPPGADWSPFVSGFPHRDRYVIARTFRDPNAARAGMVLSHALIARIDEIVIASDIRPIFDQLIAEAVAPTSLPTLSIDTVEGQPPAVPELAAVAAALVMRSAGPVVRVGHQGLEPLVSALWGQLWPAIRRGFSFRLSFGPGDLVEPLQPALVCTPASLVARWQGHRLLDRFTMDAASLASTMLTGNGAGQQLRTFADAIGTELRSFSELSLLEQAYRFAVLEPKPISNTVAAARLIDRLSPDPMCGESGKWEILNRLVHQFEGATADDILPLRNMQLQGFANSEQVWAVLGRWLAENQFPEPQDAAFRNVIADALTIAKASDNWQRAVLSGLSGAALKSGRSFPSALWRWAKADPALTAPLWTHLGASNPFEDRLVQTAPLELKGDAAQPILSYAAENGLYRLHGATAAAAYSLIEAVRLQVCVEPAHGSEGIREALRRATASQVVASAVTVGDERLVAIAADAVAKKPELLAETEISNKVARAIWSAALDLSPEVWLGPADPRAAFDQVLSDVLDGAVVSVGLIDRLANTPLGDLSAFARRTELWSKVASPTRDRLLRMTASGWLKNAEGGHAPCSVEPLLHDAILGDCKLDTLLDCFATNRIAEATAIVAALPRFDEFRFRHWLSTAAARTRLIPTIDAELVGRLAVERRWHGVVGDLLRMLHSGREDIRPALRACVSQIGLMDRWFYGLSQITAEEKWASLENLAAQLYPTGPDHEGLWERAGGYAADLDCGGSGRARWRNALGKVRLGKCPRVQNLLREMQEDFEENKELRFLVETREFGGHR